MDDIKNMIQILQSTLLRRLGDEVDLIFQYGSTLTGSTHPYSDVDLSYVPVHNTTGESITVLVGERLYDLYPMHWPHLERMAEFEDLSQPSFCITGFCTSAPPTRQSASKCWGNGCKRRDMLSIKGSLISLYHELSRALAQVYTGIEYTGFNKLDEYEQDLVVLGSPALLPHLFAADFAGLHRQCLLFDIRLKEFLSGQSVELNAFATVEDLEMFLGL